MKKILLLSIFLAICIFSFSQSTVLLRGDTIRVYKQGGTATLKVDSIIMVTKYRAGAATDSVVTWDPVGKTLRMRDGTSIGGGGAVDSVTLENDTLFYYIGATPTTITPVVRYNFTAIDDWDLFRWDNSNGEVVNYKSTYIDATVPTLKMLVRDTVTGIQYHTIIPTASDTTKIIQVLDTLTDLDAAYGNVAIIEGRLWLKFGDSWRRQAYDTSYTPPTYLLDIAPGAAAAYSFRKLRAAYSGDVIRVRRSSDDTEQDFGFLADYLDTASIKTFVGANSGLVVKEYDQSGNSNDISRLAGPSNQPFLIVSGVLQTQDGFATINYGDETQPQLLEYPTGFLNGATALSYFQVATITDYGSSNGALIGPGNSNSVGLEILQTSVISRRTLLRIRRLR